MPNLRPLSLALGLALASLTSTHAAPAAPAVATAAAKTAPQGVNVSDTWNLKDLYPSVEAWEAERKALAADIPKVKARKGTLGASSQSLLAAMEEMSQLRRRLARLAVYASLESDADTRVAPAAERNRLAGEGSSFRAVLDATRRELARDHLGRGLSTKEVAYLLGFSEPAAFQHACLRWFGRPAGDMRKSLRRSQRQ